MTTSLEKKIVSGNEAISLAVLDSFVSSSYAYPGTPSTEIMEYLRKNMKNAFWTTNEKTALESALGVSFIGKRAFVAMKHVGLNVASDPFLSGATLKINGGIVVLVADDPSMHSSQNEQDSRYYADFAKVPCFEPSNIQECFDMTKEAFNLSERLNKIVLIRTCTRLSHSKGILFTNKKEESYVEKKVATSTEWNVVPFFGKQNWARVLKEYPILEKTSENIFYNFTNEKKGDVGVITTGIAKEYFNEMHLTSFPHLHIGFYPFPKDKIKEFLKHLKKLYVIEEGYPYLERYIKGIADTKFNIHGKLDGTFNIQGELTPDIIKNGFHLNDNFSPSKLLPLDSLPTRPPQLCKGCPHRESFTIIKEVLLKNPDVIINSDIGCYSLGSLPPFSLPITLVDMGASISMAKGVSDSGKKAIAVIGDSTFFHSGLTGLIDAVASNSNIVVIILDNSTTAMTGGQPQILPSKRIQKIAIGIGVAKEHICLISPIPSKREENIKILETELKYFGVSVIISKQECIETLRKAIKNKQR